MITAEAEKYLAQGADFLIFTGGMSVDPDDLTPGAIRRLGAEIVTHGGIVLLLITYTFSDDFLI